MDGVNKDNQNTLFAEMDRPHPNLRHEPVIRVAMDAGADALFDYRLPEHLGAVTPGQRVEVPFGKGNRPNEAFVVETGVTPHKRPDGRGFRLKQVKRIVDAEPLVAGELFELARWISRYYVCPLGQVLAAMVPAAVKQDAGVRTQMFVSLSKHLMKQSNFPVPSKGTG